VAIWAHNAHIAREPDTAERSLGQNLAETFGSSYYPIGFLSYRGAGRAWDKAGKIGVIPQELGPTQPYNVESVVMAATGFPLAAWVRLDNLSAPVARWLAVPRFVREFGAPLDPAELQILRGLPNAFSAVVVIQHTGPTTPTPTGVRKATP
jgi:erythromycin esterase-like protein